MEISNSNMFGGYRLNDSGTSIVYDPTLENNCGRPYIFGDPPFTQPGDYFPPIYPGNERIWPQFYPITPYQPFIPPLDRQDQIDSIIKKAQAIMEKQMAEKKPEYSKDKVRLRDSRTQATSDPNKLEANYRAIDIVVASYSSKQISIKVKNNKITVAPLFGGDYEVAHWPMLDFYEFDIDETTEEVVSAKITVDSILTILIKNTYVAPPEKVIPISE